MDLRSDTVTRPTPAMFEAMTKAPLGDDVLGDEPTVRELEELAAQRTGKETALFVPSGTMGNQIALATHTRPGDSVIFEEEAHMVFYEGGAPGVIAGVTCLGVPSVRGTIDPETLERKLLKRSEHTPGTSLICLENTHNRAGGAIVRPEALRLYRQIADRTSVRLHLDGARMFNASVALGVDVRAITDPFDTVNFCLSKALCAPVGSVLCGPADFIKEARYWRKRLGGGMRQSGILAACGLVALRTMVDRLAEDHARAKRLGDALSGVPGITVDTATIETNFVMPRTAGPADEWAARLHREGVWCMPFGPNTLRLVLHHDVDDLGVSRTVDAFSRVAKGL